MKNIGSFPIGSRMLVTIWPLTFKREITIVEFSPSREYVKLRCLTGHEYWEETENVRVLECLNEGDK